MISFIVYEGLDFAWHFGKLIYNITTGTYKWYYGNKIVNEDEFLEVNLKKIKDLEQIELDNTIIINNLQNRIKKLENAINQKK
tara:strand:- start:509 stop:757 length:249 start_codon:yes stop_codon:yes gene_type:complete